MFRRCLFAGVLFTVLSGCATSTALKIDREAYPSGGHKTAVVGAAVVADVALTVIAAGMLYGQMLDGLWGRE